MRLRHQPIITMLTLARSLRTSAVYVNQIPLARPAMATEAAKFAETRNIKLKPAPAPPAAKSVKKPLNLFEGNRNNLMHGRRTTDGPIFDNRIACFD